MAQIIYISDPQDKTKQTLFSAHLAIVLAEKNKTSLISNQNEKLEMFLAKRHHFNLKNNDTLPVPAYFSSLKNLNPKADFSFVVLDVHTFDFLKETDILLTFADNTDIANDLTDVKSSLSSALWNAKKARGTMGKNAFKHFVVPSLNLDEQTLQKLRKSAMLSGYILTPPFDINPLYAKGFESGITFLDKNLPAFKKDFLQDDFFARRNLKHLLEFIFSIQ
ncbi:MAG: hypothetical protein IJ870_04895 [Alphaproteobacteria bacterium]|nr:hypothetical protein [Alphaproteobacteria bacterium]